MMKAADVERAAELLDRRKRLAKMLKHIADKVGAAKGSIQVHGDWQDCDSSSVEFPGAEAQAFLLAMFKAIDVELIALGVDIVQRP
jgi:hypothetical protein